MLKGIINGSQTISGQISGRQYHVVGVINSSGEAMTVTLNKLYELRGYSAYDAAVINGFEGTEEEWLKSLKGKSAYEIAVAFGFEGTEQEWLESLEGKDGQRGSFIFNSLQYEPTEWSGTITDNIIYHYYYRSSESNVLSKSGLDNVNIGDVALYGDYAYPVIYVKLGTVYFGQRLYRRGESGKDGYTPIKNVDYFDGEDGKDGKDGYTPVKGKDYFTEADKQEIAEEAAALVETPEGVWEKPDGQTGIKLKGTNGSVSGNFAISAGDDKTASDGTAFKSVASGDHAVVFGYGNTCSGRTTLAQGLYNKVESNDSAAFGQKNVVRGTQSFAAGQQNEITGRLGVTLGYSNKATNTNCFAAGYQNTASGSGSIAIGDTCESSGVSAVAMGYHTKASGDAAVTLGKFTKTTGAGEVAMGEYNQSVTSGDPSQQTAFSFGIGTSDTVRANAFEIKKNGDVYFGGKSFVQAVIDALPIYNGEVVEE